MGDAGAGDGYAVLADVASAHQYFYAASLSLFHLLPEFPVGCVVGDEFLHPAHLYYKHKICFVPILDAFSEASQMFYAPFRGSVREHADAIVLQRNSFHFDEDFSASGFNVEIEPRIPAEAFREYFRVLAEQS